MEGQHQVERWHGAMHVAPPVVGETLPERQHENGESGVERPFAHVLGELAQLRIQAVVLGLGQPASLADERLDDVAAQLDEPVGGAEADGEDAGPLVQAIDAVHAAQRLFQPGRAHGEQHGERHQRERGQAGQIKALATRDPGQCGLRRINGGGERAVPDGGDEGEQQNEDDGHDRSAFNRRRVRAAWRAGWGGRPWASACRPRRRGRPRRR